MVYGFTMKSLRWIITAAYAGFIFYLSSLPPSEVPEPFAHSDKVLHVFLYLVLAALCVWSLRTTALRDRAMLPHIAAVLATLYGATDEMHQMLVEGRDASLADLSADAAGSVMGAAIAIVLIRHLAKARRQDEVADQR